MKLFWTLAHSADATTEIMDQALSAHVKILDYSCTQYREQQKNRFNIFIIRNSSSILII